MKYPNINNLSVVHHVLKYLNGISNKGLFFMNIHVLNSLNFEMYNEVGERLQENPHLTYELFAWFHDILEIKKTSNYFSFLAKLEHCALTSLTLELLLYKKLLRNYGVNLHSMMVFCDSKSFI